VDTIITIQKSNTADTRTCDWSKVTKSDLLAASKQHIGDVRSGIYYLIQRLQRIAEQHDRTKLTHIDKFHEDFSTGFATTQWWEMHQKEERHHFNTPESIQDDVNLLDILEQITDGVMAGMARSGEYRLEPVSNELLQKAYKNTAQLLLNQIEVID
jgi:hypothetical protein